MRLPPARPTTHPIARVVGVILAAVTLLERSARVAQQRLLLARSTRGRGWGGRLRQTKAHPRQFRLALGVGSRVARNTIVALDLEAG